MKYLVLTAIDNLGWPEIRIWAESLRGSGYAGDIAIMVYRTDNVDVDLLTTKCEEHNIKLVLCTHDINGNEINHHEHPYGSSLVCRNRFFHYWQYLTQKDTPSPIWVISTDARDVVFQDNPIHYIDCLDGETILASSEGQKYKDEEWNKSDLIKAFGPFVYQQFEDVVVCNAGVMAIDGAHAADMFLHIYLMSCRTNTSAGDQAAYNLLLDSKLAFVATHNMDWACQIGTTLDPHKPHLMKTLQEELPYFDENGIVYNYEDMPYYIVHQYDRNPELKRLVEKRYEA
jgi:hypothetical protein